MFNHFTYKLTFRYFVFCLMKGFNMKKLLLLSLLLSSQFAYGMQYGWGDNPDAVVIKDPVAVHVFTDPRSTFPLDKLGADASLNDTLVIVDREGNSYRFLFSEVELKHTNYSTTILAEDGDLVFFLLDTEIHYHSNESTRLAAAD